MGPAKSLAQQGHAYQPTPWDVAHELWYWSDFAEEADVPLPEDFILYRKFDRFDFPLD